MPNALAVFERKMATILIGVISMTWSLVPFIGTGERTLFAVFIRESGLGNVWFAIMFMVGLLQVIGGACPRRNVRHIGLVLGSMVWGTTWLLFMAQEFITPVTMSMLLFSAFCIALLIVDVMKKPREPANE